jgi:hypothetical protein
MILVAIGYLSATGFSLIGIVCAKTNARSYREAWSRSVNENTAWMPATALFARHLCSVLSWYDTGRALPSVLRVDGNAVSLVARQLGVTTFFILTPLCLLKI